MFNRLKNIKANGYYPDTILDIGAHKGWWTNDMKNIYDSCTYYLFEATNYPELKQFNNINNVNVYTDVILNDKVTEVEWYSINGTGDSFFKENTHYYDNCISNKRQTIDLNTFILQHNILTESKNILIKIDCQGSEIPILKGCTDILNRTDFIILEMPFFGQYNEGVPDFLEHITFMNSIGFVVYDVLDTHNIRNFTMQVDFLFINKKHQFNATVNQKL